MGAESRTGARWGRHFPVTLFTLVFAALVIWGFSRRLFAAMAQGQFDKPPLVHFHAILFFGWTVLLVAQSLAAARGRMGWHRKAGALAAWLPVPMVLSGTIVAARDTVHDYRAGDGEDALAFFYGELADLLIFGLLAGAGIALRRRPDWHKRLVLFGSLGLLGAALGRIPLLADYGLWILFGMAGWVALFDLFSERRIHPATVTGAAVFLGLNRTQEMIGYSAAWLNAAHRMLGV